MNTLELKNVIKTYQTNRNINTIALNGVDLTVKANEFIAIMGSSGSGKTTLLNVASGIDKCDKGDINIWNNNICKMKKNDLSIFRRNNIGMVFQDFNLLNSLSIRENIMVPLILDKKMEIVEGNCVEECAKRFDIEGILEKYPYEISGGQMQRAAICRAIINNPKILFADEPTGNLDSKSSEKVLSYFELVQRSYDTSILMVTHDPFSASYCERVVFLQDGSIIEEIEKQGSSVEFLDEIMKSVQYFNSQKIKK
jgi:putative ABC transport system ATP-binding protein